MNRKKSYLNIGNANHVACIEISSTSLVSLHSTFDAPVLFPSPPFFFRSTITLLSLVHHSITSNKQSNIPSKHLQAQLCHRSHNLLSVCQCLDDKGETRQTRKRQLVVTLGVTAFCDGKESDFRHAGNSKAMNNVFVPLLEEVALLSHHEFMSLEDKTCHEF